jgi:hypothetical protein
MSDFEAEVAVRYRLGLPPVQAMHRCPLCERDMVNDPWHCLSCESTRRRAVTRVHDSVANTICAFARQCGCVASVSFDGGGLTPDGQVHTLEATWYFDVSGVHILAPSHLRSATPGSAVAARVAAKHRKYDNHASNHQSKFVPVVLDRFGSMAKESEDFLETIANEVGTPGSRVSPHCSPTSFRQTISRIWQVGNARILREWRLLCRQAAH